MSRMALAMSAWVAERAKKPRSRTKRQEKDRDGRTEAAVKRATHDKVFTLDGTCVCGRCKPREDDVMHETVKRSATRGRPPEERFNSRICVRLSRRCHDALHGVLGRRQTLTIHFLDPTLGADGEMVVTRNGVERVYRRQHG